MKKVFICLMCFFLIACSSQSTPEDQNYQTYQKLKEVILSKTTFDQPNDFQISLRYHQLEEQYRYDIIINEPQVDMYHIQALCYNNEKEDDMCPSLGVFDNEEFHMKPGYVNKQTGYYKGIQLSGISNQKNAVLVYISYYIDLEQTQKREYIMKVKENEIR